MTDVQTSGMAPSCGPDAPTHCVAAKDDTALATLLLAHQRDVTLLVDGEGVIKYASPSVTPLAGYAQEDVHSTNMLGYIHPDEAADVAEAYLRFTGGHDDPPLQFRIRTAAGFWLWCEARMSQIVDTAYQGFTVVNLREIEHSQRLRAHIRTGELAVGMGSWRWDLREDSPEWSDGLFALVGLERRPGPIDIHEAYALWHRDDQERIGTLITEALENPCNFDTVARILHADGHYITAQLYGYVETNCMGEPIALVGVVHDITRQRNTEAALKESERQYRLIVEQATDLIARYDAEGRCTFMSPAGSATLGYDIDEFVGNSPLRFVHKDDRSKILAVFERSQRGEDSTNVAYRGVHKDGSTIWLEANAKPHFDDAGQLKKIIIVARDISERKATEDSLRAAREKAETANRTKSRFLANMSHELRTPLNAVIGFSDIMCEEMFGELGSEQYKDYSKLIRESGQFLLELINDILDMSKIEAGKYELYLEELQLHKLADGALRLVHQRAREKQLRLNIEIDPNLPRFHADERAVKQVLLNLLSNAVKFTPERGMISLSAVHSEGFLLVTVQDTGIGIAEDVIPRLARPFEQAMDDSLLAQAGAGLGLALVKSFVMLHGGELRIESELGEGTCVSFTLPLVQDGYVARSA